MDTGPVYGVTTEQVRPTDTSGDLLDRLATAAPGCSSRPSTASSAASCARCRSRPTASASPRRSPSTTPASTGRAPARARRPARARLHARRPAPGRPCAASGSSSARSPLTDEVLPAGEVAGDLVGTATTRRAARRRAARGQGRDARRRLAARPAPRAGGALRVTPPPAGAPARAPAAEAARTARRPTTSRAARRTTCCVAVREKDAYANLVLPGLLRERGITGRDAALATELAYGALRGQGLYDAVLQACVDRPLAKVDPPVLDVLRLGAHQLLRTRIPPHAAVSATVDLARRVVSAGPVGFVNAVLRKVAAKDLADLGGRARADRRPARGARPRAQPPAVDRERLPRRPRRRPVADRRGARRRRRPARGAPRRPPDAPRASSSRASGGTPGPVVAVRRAPGRGRPGRARAPCSPAHAGVQDEGSQLVAAALAARAARRPRPRCGSTCAPAPAARRRCSTCSRSERGARLLALEAQHHRARLVRRSGVRGRRHDRLAHPAAAARLGRPGAARRAVQRARRAAAPARGALAAAAGRPARPHPAAGRAARRRRRAAAPGRPAGLRHLLAAPGRDRRARRRRRCAGTPSSSSSTPGRCCPGVPDLGDGPTVQLWPHLHGTDAMFLALLRRRA